MPRIAFKSRKRKRRFTPVRRPLGKRQAKAVATIARKQISRTSEWKHYTKNTTINPSTAGSLVDLSEVTQGDGDTNRDGDSIFASSLQVRGVIESADSFNRVRLIFFQWTPVSAPALSDLLITSAGYEVSSMYNTDKASNYKILSDRTYLVNQDVSGNADVRQIFMKIRINRRKIQYQAGGTTGARKVFLFAISDSGVSSHPTVELVTKLNYRDG